MFNTTIGKFCAANEHWQELLTQEPYNLKIKEDGEFVIFNYDQINSDFNNSIVREARGIIFKKDQWKNPVCWAFNKFGNYGESYVPEIDWSTAFVTEKIDGSLIKVWWDCDSGWHISTNGTIDAFDAPIQDVKVNNFGEYFCNTVSKYYTWFGDFTNELDHDLTYMFELVGPYNRVVIPYDRPDICFIGARNKFTGEEHVCSNANLEKLGLTRFKCPTQWSLASLEDCIKIAEELPWDQEGFVVVDAYGNRVKIKSPAYVMAHFARNNNVITRKHLIKVILMNEVEEFLCYAADYKEELLYVQKLMNVYHNIGETLAAMARSASRLPRNEFANIVKLAPKVFQGLMFVNYDKDCYAKEYTIGWTADKWDRYLTEVEKLGKEYFGND